MQKWRVELFESSNDKRPVRVGYVIAPTQDKAIELVNAEMELETRASYELSAEIVDDLPQRVFLETATW